MATKSHEGNIFVGDVVTYGVTALWGQKILKAVWIDAVRDTMYVVQQGKIRNNQFTPTKEGKELSLLSFDTIKGDYDLTWTPDKLAPVKGDILSGTDEKGNTVVLVFKNDMSVLRITKCSFSATEQSHGSLGFYKSKLKDLRVLKDEIENLPFSKVWQA